MTWAMTFRRIHVLVSEQENLSKSRDVRFGLRAICGNLQPLLAKSPANPVSPGTPKNRSRSWPSYSFRKSINFNTYLKSELGLAQP